MFDVRCYCILDERWEERDATLYRIAGKSDSSEASKDTVGVKRRIHVWSIYDFQEAQALRKKLEEVEGVQAVTIQESGASCR